ncbi:MAG: transporter, family, multidrug/chloramphenicol efflux transport protein [Pseudomonadota bacterium]|nr:transporter, family, multidrug/chloramphenicol efflux transport protein [Pseudomonadota bacterium]
MQSITSKKQLHLFAIFFVLYELDCYLSNDMIMPAMLQVINQFHAPLSSVSLSLSLFVLGGGILPIFLGPLVDRIGKRRVMLVGNIGFLVATLFIPFATSINQFLAARFFQGMGMCFIFIGYAMIHEYFNDTEAVKLTSLLTNIAIFAPLIGPVVGSGITAISRWEFVFIVSGVLGVISLTGLYKHMPESKITQKTIDIRQIIKTYKIIFTHKTFMFGILTNGIAILPIIAWIGLSPTIIINKMHGTYAQYIIYQSIMFGGFITSNILVQKISGKVSFKNIIKYAGTISLLGVLFAALCHFNVILFIIGMCTYALGFGLCNGVIVRISIMSTGQSSSLSSSAFSVLNSIYLSGALEIYNKVCGWFDYSLASYAIFTAIIGVILYLCSLKFAKMNEHLEWRNNAQQQVQ